MANSLMLIRNIQLFKTGEHNGEKFTMNDLRQIVDAFDKVGYSVPVKFGHVEEPGLPAFGWITRIWIDGKFLMGDMEVQPFVYDQIKSTLYDSLSIEMFYDITRDGVTYPKALKAVALLGAETPGCAGIAPLREATFADGSFKKVVVFTEELNIMSNPDKEAQFAELQSTIALMKSNIDRMQSELKAKDEEIKRRDEALLTFEESSKQTIIKSAVDKLKLTQFSSIMTALAGAVFSDKKKLKLMIDGSNTPTEVTPFQMVEQCIEMLNKVAASMTGEMTQSQDHNSERNMSAEKDPGERLRVETAKYMSANKMENNLNNIRIAQKAVFAANPDLKKAYAARAALN